MIIEKYRKYLIIEQIENGNTKAYLRLPAWMIRYTDIENQKREEQNFQRSLKRVWIYSEVKNVDNVDNLWKNIMKTNQNP